MSKTKSFLSLFLLGILGFTIVSCGESSNTGANTQSNTTTKTVVTTTNPHIETTTENTKTDVDTTTVNTTTQNHTSTIHDVTSSHNTTTYYETTTEGHTHNMYFHCANPASCTDDGNYEYYECLDCGKCYRDFDGKTEIYDVIEHAYGHDLVHHQYQEPTLYSLGNIEYWECVRCEEKFSDEDGLHPLEVDPVIPMIERNYIFSKDNVFIENDYAYIIIYDENDSDFEQTVYGTYEVNIDPATCLEDGCQTTTVRFTADGINLYLGKEVLDSDLEYVFETIIEAKGHTYSSKWNYDYEYHWHDATCGHNVTTEKEAHEMGEWKITAPTVSTNGKETRSCTKCDYTETIIIPSYMVFESYNGGYRASLRKYDDKGYSYEYNGPSHLIVPETYNGLNVVALGTIDNELIDEITIPRYVKELYTLGSSIKKIHWNCSYIDNDMLMYINQLSLDDFIIENYGTITFDGRVMPINTKKYTVDSSCYRYVDVDGMLFSTDYKTLISCPLLYSDDVIDLSKYDTLIIIDSCAFLSNNAKEIIFPANLEQIGNCALQYSRIETLTIPKKVSMIGIAAFSECESLTTVYFNASNVSISYNSDYSNSPIFSLCPQLTTLYVGNSENIVKVISKNTFRNTTNLVNVYIQDGIESIGEYAFMNSGVKELVIPDSIEDIHEYAFNGVRFDKLTVKAITLPYTSINELVITYGETITYDMLKEVYHLGKVTLSEGITSIGTKAFYTKDLEEITLPTTLLSIGDYAFYSCSLKEIDIPNSVSSIGEYAFSGCSFTEFRFPEGITELSNYVLRSNTKLEEVYVPSTVTKFGTSPFDNDENITTATGPLSIFRYISNSVITFNGTSGMKLYLDSYTSVRNLTLPNTIEEFSLNDNTSVEYIVINGFKYITDINGNPVVLLGVEETTIDTLVVPKTVKVISDNAFNGNTKLKEVDLNDNLYSIMADAFTGCSALEYIYIPKDVTIIGWGAFSYCTSLTEVAFENGSNYTGTNRIFGGSNAIESITCPANVLYDGFVMNDQKAQQALKYVSINGGTYIPSNALYNAINVSHIVIPDYIEYIEEYAFYNSGITGVDLSKNITRIYERTFYNSKLESIYIPKNIKIIDKEAFYNCPLEHVSFEEGSLLESIGNYAFNGGKFTEFKIPQSVTSIGVGAFYECGNLLSISIPSSVTVILENTFYKCMSLTSIVIPNTITKISDGAFAFCKAATSLTFENGSSLKYIGYNAFKNCQSLETIEVPTSVTYIGEYAFSNCSSLKHITLPFAGTKVYTSSDDIQYHVAILFSSTNDQELYQSITCKYVSYSTGSRQIREDSYYVPKSLTSITINGCTTINNYAFYGYDTLEEITIGASVKTIDVYAFAKCYHLTTLNLSGTLEKINSSVLEDTYITNINYSATTSQWNSIEKSDFWKYNCYTLQTITCTNGVINIS